MASINDTRRRALEYQTINLREAAERRLEHTAALERASRLEVGTSFVFEDEDDLGQLARRLRAGGADGFTLHIERDHDEVRVTIVERDERRYPN